MLPIPFVVTGFPKTGKPETTRFVFQQRVANLATTDWHTKQHYSVASVDSGAMLAIAFMGTLSLEDMLVDADVRPVSSFLFDRFAGGVHSGAASRAAQISLAPFIEALRPSVPGSKPQRLLFTGHSLGGAVAMLVVLRLVLLCALSEDEASRVRCITFGAPTVIDGRLARRLDQDSRLRSVRHVHLILRHVLPVPSIKYTEPYRCSVVSFFLKGVPLHRNGGRPRARALCPP